MAERLRRVMWVSGKYARLEEGDDLAAARFHRDLRPVVGDFVHVGRRGRDVWVEEIEPRANCFMRRERGGFAGQPLAANLDRLVIVTAVGAQFRPGLVDRLLVTAAVAGIAPLLVVNKVDLTQEFEEVRESLTQFDDVGAARLLVSAKTGEGMAELAESLVGEVAVLTGHSGVGKSSLLNALVPGSEREVGELSEGSGKGRHVTTAARGFRAAGGGLVVDMPGVRLFGLVGITPAELARGFPGFGGYVGHCRFNNCTHDHEPDCAVLRALDAGTLRPERHASYLRLLDEIVNVDAAKPPDFDVEG